MICIDDVECIGQDLTPPLYPIAFSLYNTHLLSHCSACFSHLSLSVSSSSSNSTPPLYCSSQCSSDDTPLYLLSGESHLRRQRSDDSDLRAALRLLHRLSGDHCRIGGLLSNRDALVVDSEDEVCKEIKEGALAMAVARGGGASSGGECVMEEAALCVVMTNAVEVQDKNGCGVGIAVYDTTFSWINHSCSPNACFRFDGFNGETPLLIAPASIDGCYAGNISESNGGWKRYGPRTGVRNFKAITKGEEITITYTDLLQTKETRQAELWFKYRFICHCRRCSTFPLAYVDHALQDIHVAGLTSMNLTSAWNIYRDETIEILTEYMNDAISEYVKYDDAKSCCEKLEHVLVNGLASDQSPRERRPLKSIRLQPLHHLSLNAYTVLASAYKTLGCNLLDRKTNSSEHQLSAFDQSRISAAYSLLLAGAAHHLYLSESSLIISVANYWTAAGESLLNLASMVGQNLSMGQCYPFQGLSPSNIICDHCALKDKFEASVGSSHTQTFEFEQISKTFCKCITDLTQQVWIFLIQGDHYLRGVINPIDFTWLRNTKDFKVLDYEATFGSDDVERSYLKCIQEENGNQRINIFQLGAHCLLYGELILKICCGKDPQSANLSSKIH